MHYSTGEIIAIVVGISVSLALAYYLWQAEKKHYIEPPKVEEKTDGE